MLSEILEKEEEVMSGEISPSSPDRYVTSLGTEGT
jgi:hypothetical protein